MCSRPISRASGDWEGDEVKDHGQILYQAEQLREQGESFSLSVGSSRFARSRTTLLFVRALAS